ncbi:MAG: hypothetical protein LBP37_01665 [Spirochaetaceae bacterium]|jgi:hypothetical protein|nr:hypothetical protein [Spirochaetaceae bacterium]
MDQEIAMEDMMKKSKRFGALACGAVIAAVLFGACSPGERHEEEDAPALTTETGMLTVKLGLGETEAAAHSVSAALTVHPDLKNIVFDKYKLTFNPANHEPVERETGEFPEIILQTGDYTITAAAIKDGVPVAIGSAEVTINADENSSVVIDMGPNTDISTEGTLTYTITYPDGVTASLSIDPIAGTDALSISITGIQSGITENLPLPAGYYALTASFNSGDHTEPEPVYVGEVIHIYPGLESPWELEITDEYFTDPLSGGGVVLEFDEFSDIEIIDDALGTSIESSFSFSENKFLSVTGYDMVVWWINGINVTDTDNPEILELDPNRYTPGKFYLLKVFVTKNGKPYARRLQFTVSTPPAESGE